jgi:hypothetical protein
MTGPVLPPGYLLETFILGAFLSSPLRPKLQFIQLLFITIWLESPLQVLRMRPEYIVLLCDGLVYVSIPMGCRQQPQGGHDRKGNEFPD